MEVKLKPCPFCGSDHIKWFAEGGDECYCRTCQANGPPGNGDEESAFKEWNTRADLAPASVTREEIDKILDENLYSRGNQYSWVGGTIKARDAILALIQSMTVERWIPNGQWVNDPLECPTEEQKLFWNRCTQGSRWVIIQMAKLGQPLPQPPKVTP